MLYTIEPKQVIYNTRTKEVLKHFSGKVGEQIFDSVGEFKCYKVLASLGMPIEVHKHVPHLDYKVDFTLHFLTVKAKKHPILSELGYKLYKDKFLFIEFKGVLDSATVDRYGSLPDNAKASYVIVTDKVLGITYFDSYTNKILNHPTISVSQLRSLVNGS